MTCDPDTLLKRRLAEPKAHLNWARNCSYLVTCSSSDFIVGEITVDMSMFSMVVADSFNLDITTCTEPAPEPAHQPSTHPATKPTVSPTGTPISDPAMVLTVAPSAAQAWS